MLGLCLVIGLIALLIGGTLYGLRFEMRTMKSIESKMLEQLTAWELGEKIDALPHSDRKAPSGEELEQLKARISKARTALDKYEKQLQETLPRRRDPDKGFSALRKLNK